MNTGEIIILLICGLGLLIKANLHGKERTGNHNFFTQVISVILNLALLYYAGLFH